MPNSSDNVSKGDYWLDTASNTLKQWNGSEWVATGYDNSSTSSSGGNLVIDGKVTNATASISKATVAFVNSANAATDGTVLNVVDVQFPSSEATINFYMPGVADGAAITAIQYVNGA